MLWSYLLIRITAASGIIRRGWNEYRRWDDSEDAGINRGKVNTKRNLPL
jgi:hypothetical protein